MTTPDRPLSKDMKAGTRLRWTGPNRTGDGIAVLDRRKQGTEPPGWWCVGGGGLADIVIDHPQSAWEILDQPTEADPVQVIEMWQATCDACGWHTAPATPRAAVREWARLHRVTCPLKPAGAEQTAGKGGR